jgi:serine/threonine protein kinase
MLRPQQGEHVLALGARYFFRRAVEKDEQLSRGLAFARMEKLARDQERGFAAIADALEQHGDRLEQALDEVRGVVIQAHAAVLDLQAQVQGQSEEIRQLTQAVGRLLEQHQLQRRELRLSDSLSVRSDGERQAVRQLVARYRSLPVAEQDRAPALLNALGKLEVMAGDFDAAQRDFQKAAGLAPDAGLRAEAHYHAYQAALQRRDWATALTELQAALALAAPRLAPFPLDKYRPARILGAGGFGVAFLCHHAYMSDWVVVKALTGADLDQGAEQIFAEATVLRQVEHANIIRLQDCAFADPARKERPYLAMDYFEGVTLEECARQRPLPEAEVIAVATQIAAGLQAAHARGVLHRDVKPANVLVRRGASPGAHAPGSPTSWQVKLIDFGLALRPTALQGSASSRTLLGSSIAGTLDYAAPEQLGRLEGVAVSPASDVYGFARTCCYALFQTPEPTLRHWQGLRPALADLLGQCLERLPERRPQDFGAVLARLAALSSTPADVPTVVPAEPIPMAELSTSGPDLRRRQEERRLHEAAARAQEERRRLEEQERRLHEAADRAEDERRRLEERERRRRRDEQAVEVRPVAPPRPAPARNRGCLGCTLGCLMLFLLLGGGGVVLYFTKIKDVPPPTIALNGQASARPKAQFKITLDVKRQDWELWSPVVVRREISPKTADELFKGPTEVEAPFAQSTVSFTLTAPDKVGNYTLTFVPRRGSRTGDKITVKVTVTDKPSEEKPGNGFFVPGDRDKGGFRDKGLPPIVPVPRPKDEKK